MAIALFGAQPSPDDERDWSLQKFGAPQFSALPTSVDHMRHVEQIFQQRGSSCCGWGTTRAWHVRARIQGDKVVPYPSAQLNYTLGRCALQADTGPLLDEGCWPRLTLMAAKELGMVPMDRWNDPLKQNERPDWGTLRESLDRRSVAFARLFGVEEMKIALAMGHPVVVAHEVDDSFVNYSGGIWEGPISGRTSGHCMCLIGYNDEDSVPWFRGVNSWDDDFGEEGTYRISQRCIPLLRRHEAWGVEAVSAEAA